MAYMKFFRNSSSSSTTVSDQPPARLTRRSSGLGELAKLMSSEEPLCILYLGYTSAANIRYLTGRGHKIYSEDLLEASTDPDLATKDEQGNKVRLGEFFKGKPVVIALVYYTCPMLCNQVMNGMLGSFRQTSLNIGEDFEVVTVSFDTKDTPAIAAMIAAQPYHSSGWIRSIALV